MSMFDKKRSPNGFSSYAWTFAIGAITGAAVALLYAPMTGKKMQKKIAVVTENLIDLY